MRVTVTYDVVKAGATRKGSCIVCGKKMSRSRTFSQTVSPFNRDENRVPKSYDEVLKAVREQALAWNPKPDYFIHERCMTNGADQ